jgi:hypothetical protein
MERSHHKGHGPLRQRGGSRVYSGMYKAAAAGALAVGVGSFFNPDITPQQIDLTPTQTQKRAQSKAVGKARLQSIEQEQAERRATERRRAAASQAERRSLASEVNRRGKIQDQRIRQQQQQLEADQRRRAEEQQALSAAATGRTRLAGCHRPPEMNSRHSSQSSW